jgi:hypothetical protein
MAMTRMKKKYTVEELDQERREIEKEFEGAEAVEPVELIFDPNLTIRLITDEEYEERRLRPTPEEQAAAERNRD